jgi:uncharacterized protein YcbX
MADLIARIAGLWRYPVKSCAGDAGDQISLKATAAGASSTPAAS